MTEFNSINHLTVCATSAGPKSLVRGNSVVTLNQIYEHHNSIPARNRILSSAKSLQQPSIDLPEVAGAGLQYEDNNCTNNYATTTTNHQSVGYSTRGLTPSSSSVHNKQQRYSNEHLASTTTSGGDFYSLPPQKQSPKNNNNRTQQAADRSHLSFSSPNHSIQSAHPSAAAISHQVASLQQQNTSYPVTIINVARRHKKQSSDSYESPVHFQTGSGAGLSAQSSRGGAAAGPLRQGSIAGWSSDSSADSPPGNSPVNHHRPAPGSRPNRSPTHRTTPCSPRATLDVGLGGEASNQRQNRKSRSPSPAQNNHLLQQQASIEVSPLRRYLPQINQASSANEQQQRQLVGQYQPPEVSIATTAVETQQLSLEQRGKRHRKLPRIPTEAKQQTSGDSLGGSSQHLEANSSSLLHLANQSHSSSSSLSNKSPNAASGLQYPANQQQTAGNLAGEPQLYLGSYQTQQQQSLGSPRSPLLPRNNQQQQQKAAIRQSRPSLTSSSSSNSPASLGGKSPATYNLNQQQQQQQQFGSNRYFTFDQPAVASTSGLMVGGLGTGPAADAFFVCHSPGGTRTNNLVTEAGGLKNSPPVAQQQPPLLTTGNQPQVAGRGRRLSSCGSGSRANFLMSKQQAIGEFTPPRSLESSMSRGSTDFGASAAAAASNGSLPVAMGQQQQQTAIWNSQETAAGGQYYQPAGGSCLQQPQQPHVPYRRPSSAAGLPPRAASATEPSCSMLTGSQYQQPHGQSGGHLSAMSQHESYVLGAGVRSSPAARSMIAVPSAPDSMLMNATGSHNYAPPAIESMGSNRQVDSAATNLNSGQLQPTKVESSTSGSRRLASGFGLASALSIDVYHCDAAIDQPTLLSATGGCGGSQSPLLQRMGSDQTAGSSESVSLMARQRRLDSSNSQLANALAAASKQQQPRASLALPQRDRQPSNVSTSSMPAGPFGGQLQTATANCHPTSGSNGSISTGSPATNTAMGVATGRGGASQGAEQRKFGAWAQRIAPEASGGRDSAHPRWVRSAGQLEEPAATGSKRPKGRSVSSSSSSTPSPVASLSRATSGRRSASSSTTTSRCDSEDRSTDMSSSALNSELSSSSPLDSSDRKLGAHARQVIRARRKLTAMRRERRGRHKSAAATAATASNLNGRSAGRESDGRSHEEATAEAADRLTLADRLKLAEKSVSKLFRKVELSPQGQMSRSKQNSGDSTSPYSQLQQPAAAAFFGQQRLSGGGGVSQEDDGTSATLRLLSATREAGGDSHEFADDEQGDDLSLFLRSVDKQRLRDLRAAAHSAAREASAAAALKSHSDLLNSATTNSKPTAADQRPRSAFAGSAAPASGISAAAKVVRRAITLRSLVRNFSRRPSSCEPDTTPQLATSAPTEGSGRRSHPADVPEQPPPPATPQHQAADAPPSSSSAKLRQLFRRRSRPSFSQVAEAVRAARSSLEAPPQAPAGRRSKNWAPPTQWQNPPQFPHSDEEPEEQAQRGDELLGSRRQQRKSLARPRMDRMKSVITAVSRRLEPLRGMKGGAKQVQSPQQPFAGSGSNELTTSNNNNSNNRAAWQTPSQSP